MHKIVFFVSTVCCWLYEVQLGCWFGGVISPKFSLCDGSGWVSRLMSCVEEIGPTDYSGLHWTDLYKHCSLRPYKDQMLSHLSTEEMLVYTFKKFGE